MHNISDHSSIHDIVFYTNKKNLKELSILVICLQPYIHSDFDILPCLRSTTHLNFFFYECWS